LETQAKLLRVLQESQFERVGGSETLTVDVRFIATTNRILKDEIAAGRFRADLFYRLNVYPITIPPLRNRKDDIPLLIQYFVPRIASPLGKTVDKIPPHVMDQLTSYEWPGNVRELRNVLERAIITSQDRILILPERIGSDATQSTEVNASNGFSTLEAIERQHIMRVLEATGWRISGPKGTAEILGLNPSTLRSRLKKLGIQR
jgi:transcriptional regulator with GAF, ATPase, and Fis domain